MQPNLFQVLSCTEEGLHVGEVVGKFHLLTTFIM